MSLGVTLVRSPWFSTFRNLVSTVERQLILVSPFIKTWAASEVIAGLSSRHLNSAIRVQVITNIRPESMLSGAMDPEALIEITRAIPNVELTHLPSLHAKTYIADDRMAVVTSGNLTDSGIRVNLEYGVAFTDSATVSQIRKDFEAYALLGAIVSASELKDLLDEITELRRAYKVAERSIRARARRAFNEKLEASNLRILRHRAKGKTTHAIFADTILFILARGPLRTSEIHPLVKSLQPDICDDSIDRIIDGVHFGKKWKHYVRNAQQFLKRQGQIRYDGQRGHLVSST